MTAYDPPTEQIAAFKSLGWRIVSVRPAALQGGTRWLATVERNDGLLRASLIGTDVNAVLAELESFVRRP